MLLGVHISGEKRISEAVDKAQALGCNTMQIFSRNPQRWRENFLEPQDIKEFNRRQEKFKIRPLFIHIPYLINLASPNPRLYNASIEAYIEDILETEVLGADFIVTHMGSHKETSETEGIQRLITALNTIIEKTKNTRIGILLENTAGSGSWLGYTFKHHKDILDGIKDKKRISICLDTCHAYVAGYDLASKDGLENILKEINNLIGLEKLQLVHLNDAKDKLGSHRDRHEHIGKGRIGLEGMQRIINHPKLRSLPFILETPKKNQDDDIINLNTVRKLRRN